MISYDSDAYNWFGVHEMALALRDAGLTKESAEWSAEADQYHEDILNSMQSALFQEHGVTVLPIEPLTHRLEKQGAEFYYALVAPQILETEFFSATDPHYRWLTDYMEQRGGLLLGVDRVWDGIDHAYTYGYGMEQLRHGNVDRFLLTFYSSLAYGMTRDTYSAVEVTRITEGYNEGTLPHTYSNTQQLRMLRMMFLKEEPNELWLAPATPRAWLDTRDGFSIRNAPTNYGTISYRVLPEPEAGLVRVSIDAPAGETIRPSRVRLRLASNLGKLQSATLNGKNIKIDGDTVVLDGASFHGKLEVVASYK